MNKGPSQNIEGDEEDCKLFRLENEKFKKTMRSIFKYVISCPGKGETDFRIPISRRCTERKKKSVSSVNEKLIYLVESSSKAACGGSTFPVPRNDQSAFSAGVMTKNTNMGWGLSTGVLQGGCPTPKPPPTEDTM